MWYITFLYNFSFKNIIRTNISELNFNRPSFVFSFLFFAKRMKMSCAFASKIKYKYKDRLEILRDCVDMNAISRQRNY